MDIEQLRYFQCVAEVETFSLAAIKLGVSQPSISRQIRSLENELGLRLFYRHGRGVALTEAGRKLYHMAVPLVQQLNNIVEELCEDSTEPSGAVSIGMPSSIIGTMGSAVVHRFLLDYPKATLKLYEGPSGLLLEKLEGALLDIAILYESRRGSNMLVEPLLEEDLFLITPPSVLRGEGPDVSIEEVEKAPLILPSPLSGLRRSVDRVMQANGLGLNLVLEMHSVTTIKNLVERAVGFAVFPFGIVHREIADGRLGARKIALPEMSAILVTATAVGQPITRAMRAVQEIINLELHRCVNARQLRGRVLVSQRPGFQAAESNKRLEGIIE